MLIRERTFARHYTFPVPSDYSSLKSIGEKILEIRKQYPNSTLAELYDPLGMPTELEDTHYMLDKKLERLYRKKPFSSDDERLEFLFDEYRKMTSKQTTL